MAEYISKDELMQYLKPLTNKPAIVIKRYVEDIPAVDVQPVKRGKWLNNKYEHIVEIDGNLIHAYCSNCKRIAFTIDSINRKIDYELCPHCGADMRNE